jgi:ABC-2 type transport system permease protein
MQKYFQIASISLSQEIAYRVNFLMSRIRNILQIFLLFFLWEAVFASEDNILGYTRSAILTYIFGVYIIKSIVFSVRSNEVAGEIARGDLTIYLLKPINYLKYWFTRDIATKVINIIFTFFEILFLYILLKPPINFPVSGAAIFLFLISIGLAVIIYFLLLMLFSMFPFWYPEGAWGFTFLLLVFIDFLGGGVFPLDIFPSGVVKVLYLTPFPYLLFVPLQIYLEKMSISTSFWFVFISLAWVAILLALMNLLWKRGLRVYRAEGR